MQRRDLLTASLAAGLSTWARAADPGISDKEILIGQSAVLSGPLGVSMKEFDIGAQLAFEELNSHGGIGGRSIRLLSLDDELKPDRTVANYTKLINEDKVFAMFGGVGSGPIAAATPLLRETGVPLIGNYALSDAARNQAKGAAYFLRATYSREAEKIVQHLSTLGIYKLAVAHLDNPGGVEVLSLVRAALKAAKPDADILASAAVKNDGSNVDAAVKTLAAAHAQAVVMFLSGPPIAQLMKGMWAAGESPSFYGMSVVAGEKVAAELGTKLRGLAVCQIMPYPWSQSEPLARSFQQLCEKSKATVSYYSWEGYLNALVLIEALKRSGKEPTRAALHNTMKNLKMRLAGLDLDFSDGVAGSHFVELVQVTSSGRYVR